MKYETKILSTRYPRPDAYGSLAMPVYHTAAFEFPSAKAMSDAFCGRSAAPSYSRIANPTVSHLEERVRQWTGALSVTALNTGMAAVAYALTAVSAAGLNIVASRHLFGNSLSLLRDTLGTLGVEARFADFTCPDAVAALTDDNTLDGFYEGLRRESPGTAGRPGEAARGMVSVAGDMAPGGPQPGEGRAYPAASPVHGDQDAAQEPLAEPPSDPPDSTAAAFASLVAERDQMRQMANDLSAEVGRLREMLEGYAARDQHYANIEQELAAEREARKSAEAAVQPPAETVRVALSEQEQKLKVGGPMRRICSPRSSRARSPSCPRSEGRLARIRAVVLKYTETRGVRTS